MKRTKKFTFTALTCLSLPLLTLNSCVEAVALGVIATDLIDQEEEAPLPELIMHDGAHGRHPIARTAGGQSTFIFDPYTNKLVNALGEQAGQLKRSSSLGSKKYYIPHLSQFPTAVAVEGKPGYFLNPYDSREVYLAKAKPATLVSSATAGTYYYLPK